jgi:hypothetical protein
MIFCKGGITSVKYSKYRSHTHEQTISLRFLGIILRVLRLEVSKYNIYITNKFQATLAHGEGGVKSTEFHLYPLSTLR